MEENINKNIFPKKEKKKRKIKKTKKEK